MKPPDSPSFPAQTHYETVPPGIIFDLDGTLADTLLDITDAVNVALESIGMAPLPPSRVQPLVGEGLPTLVSRASGRNDDATVAALVRSFRSRYTDHLLDRTSLYPGIAPTLDRLAQAGCPLAVLSNKPHDSTQTICRTLLRDWPFRECWGARDGQPKKPDPTAALALAERLRRPASRVCFVGDSAVDVATALASGMRPIGVTWGFREARELIDAGARVLIDEPAQLVQAILG